MTVPAGGNPDDHTLANAEALKEAQPFIVNPELMTAEERTLTASGAVRELLQHALSLSVLVVSFTSPAGKSIRYYPGRVCLYHTLLRQVKRRAAMPAAPRLPRERQHAPGPPR